MSSLYQLLQGNPYPGRGILLGRTADNRALIAYFIMGRSVNSRNRVFTEKDGGIITEAFDPSKLTDPSLIIYAPVRVFDAETTIVTNGDQTDTVFDALAAGRTFEDALRTRTFEPDPPNFTPRISGLLQGEGRRNGDTSCPSSRRARTRAPCVASSNTPSRRPGEGHFLSTYVTDGNPLPSFQGEPVGGIAWARNHRPCLRRDAVEQPWTRKTASACSCAPSTCIRAKCRQGLSTSTDGDIMRNSALKFGLEERLLRNPNAV